MLAPPAMVALSSARREADLSVFFIAPSYTDLIENDPRKDLHEISPTQFSQSRRRGCGRLDGTDGPGRRRRKAYASAGRYPARESVLQLRSDRRAAGSPQGPACLRRRHQGADRAHPASAEGQPGGPWIVARERVEGDSLPCR